MPLSQLLDIPELYREPKFSFKVLHISFGGPVARAKGRGVRLIEAEESGDGRVDLSSLRSVLSELKLHALYCEGGPTLARSLLESGQVDYLFNYRSPKIFEGEEALPGPGLAEYGVLEPLEEQFGEDRLTHGFL